MDVAAFISSTQDPFVLLFMAKAYGVHPIRPTPTFTNFLAPREHSSYRCRCFPGSSLLRSLIAGCAAAFATTAAPSQNPWLRT